MTISRRSMFGLGAAAIAALVGCRSKPEKSTPLDGLMNEGKRPWWHRFTPDQSVTIGVDYGDASDDTSAWLIWDEDASPIIRGKLSPEEWANLMRRRIS